MKLIKVTGSMTIETLSVDAAQAFIRMNDATGDAEVIFEEIGEAPAWRNWKVTPDQAAQIDALLGIVRAQVEEVPASV